MIEYSHRDKFLEGRQTAQKNKLALLLGALAVATLLLVGHLLTSSEPETSPVSQTPAASTKKLRPAPDAETILAEIDARRRREAAANIEQMPSQDDVGSQRLRDRVTAEGDVAAVIALSGDGFQPVNFEVRASSSPLNLPLSRSRPESVGAEPRYAGAQQWYGTLKLGSPRRNFTLVLDLTPEQRIQMWFDANANGDLTDDPGPLTNQGSGHGGPGGFATLLRVPWETLAAQAKFRGDFEIWFYSNKSGWEQGNRASHYSRTQLRGEAIVNGRRYLAWVADRDYNDADLTNDGLLVDLNANGKADRDEWFADLHTDDTSAAGARGRVKVHW